MYFSHTKWFYGDTVTLRMSVLETREMTQKVKELAVQAWWLEFDPQNPHIKSDEVVSISLAVFHQVGRVTCSTQWHGEHKTLLETGWKVRANSWKMSSDTCPHTYISYTSLSDTDTHIHMCTKDYNYRDWENSSVSRALAGKLWIPDLRSLVPIGKPREAYPCVISALGCQRQADLYWSVSLNQMQTPEAEESLSQRMRWKVIEDNT